MFLARILTGNLRAMDNNDLKTPLVKPTVDTTDGDKLQEQPFRYLNLPKELCLIVYDHLPTYETTHIFIKKRGHVELVTRTECIPILQTCHTINEEASKHMKSNRSRYLASSGSKILMMYTGDIAPLRSRWPFSTVLVILVLRLISAIINEERSYKPEIWALLSGQHTCFSLAKKPFELAQPKESTSSQDTRRRC
jgi:hypothetical protein